MTRLVAGRGITWGMLFPDSPAEQAVHSADRGVLFLACQTSIVDQFEVLNTRWMNRTGAPEGRSGHDLLVGHHDPAGRGAQLHIDHTVVELNPSVYWVIPTGGGYFFTPSISTLRRLRGATVAHDVGSARRSNLAIRKKRYALVRHDPSS